MKVPNTNLALFLNSDGVAMGRAMKKAKHSLWYDMIQNICILRKENLGNVQDIEDNVGFLEACNNNRVRAAKNPMH